MRERISATTAPCVVCVLNVDTASASFQNDETLLLIRSPLLARHFEAEMDRLWRGA